MKNKGKALPRNGRGQERHGIRLRVMDVLLGILLIVGLLLLFWQYAGQYEKSKESRREIRCTVIVENYPETAVNLLRKGDIIYGERGQVLGTVTDWPSYTRPDGNTMRLILTLETEAEKQYDGYHAGETLWSIGQSYRIQTKDYGGRAVCWKIEESQQS